MAQSVKGTQLALAATTTSAYTNVYEVTDLTVGAITRERIDVTALGTTNDQRLYIGGFLELGETVFTVNYEPAQPTHAGDTLGLAGLMVSGTTVAWKVEPSGSTDYPILFKGYVSNFQPGWSVGEQAVADVSIQITTLPSYSTST
jgi:hypothetical protein